jgi:uncharacterized Tic20 family protein
MTIFDYLKLIVQIMSIVLSDGPNGVSIETKEEDIDIFGVKLSMKKHSQTLVARELFLFWRLFIPLSKCLDPLAWWRTHESELPNVGFLPKQILEILRFQIETKQMVSLVGVLIACWLQVENFDRTIIVVMNCLANVNFKDYIKFEITLAKENYELIEELKVEND